MKLLKQLFKSIEQKSKLDLITELLIVGNSTEEALQLFEKAKANFLHEMKKREEQNNYECRLINQFSSKERKPYDANFDKPLAEIETTYTIENGN
jgi:hypothetical protein